MTLSRWHRLPLTFSSVITGLLALSLLLATGLLTGCGGAGGFHLRGTKAVPAAIRQLQVIAPDNPFRAVLLTNLQALQIDTSSQNGPRLRILNVQPVRQQLAGRIIEVQLGVNVSFQLEQANGERLGDVRQVQARRSYQFDSRAVSNQAQEEATLTDEAYREAARQVVRQIINDRTLGR